MGFIEWSSNKIESGARGLLKSPFLLIGGMLVIALLKLLAGNKPGGLDD